MLSLIRYFSRVCTINLIFKRNLTYHRYLYPVTFRGYCVLGCIYLNAGLWMNNHDLL